MDRGHRSHSNRRVCWVLEVNAEREAGIDLRAVWAMRSAIWFRTNSTGGCFGSHKCREETCCKDLFQLHVS